MENLPPEILILMFKNLDTYDLFAIRQVSHRFNQIATPMIKLDLRIEHSTEGIVRVQIKPFQSIGYHESKILGSEFVEEFLADLITGKFDFILQKLHKISARCDESDTAPIQTFLNYIKEKNLDQNLCNLCIASDMNLDDPSLNPLQFLNWIFTTYPHCNTALIFNIEKSNEKAIRAYKDKLVLGPNVQELALNTFMFYPTPVDDVSYDFVLEFIQCPPESNLKALSISDAAAHIGEYQATVELNILQKFLRNCTKLERMSINFHIIGADSNDTWLPAGVTEYNGNWFYQLDPDWFQDMEEAEYMDYAGYWGPSF